MHNNISDSDEATEVAQAYDKAEIKNQNTVRIVLDLPLKQENKIVELKPKKDEIKEDIKHDDDIMDDPNF